MIYQLKASKTYFNLNYNISLNKDKKVYCFIGKNGVGKTKLLETMCSSLIYSHEVFKDNNIINFRNSTNLDKELKEKLLEIPKEIELNNEKIRPSNDWSHFKLSDVNSINKIKYINPFKFIGAKNRGHNPNFDKNNIKLLGTKLERFSHNLKETIDSLNNKEVLSTSVADWFVSRIIGNTGLVVEGDVAHEEMLYLCKILNDLDKETFKNLISPNSQGGHTISIYILEGKLYFNFIPFESLPSGYMGVIKIVQDIIDTYGSWALKSKTDYNDKLSIFIDEIEAHLHPKWESKIIPLLKKHFPNATLYITTHSPTIVGSTQEGEAYELVNNDAFVEARKLGNPRNWYLADVYSQAFHLDDFLDNREKEKEETIDEFKKFSEIVKTYLKTKEEIQLKEGLEIFKKLKVTLSNDDPRLITLNNLKSLLK